MKPSNYRSIHFFLALLSLFCSSYSLALAGWRSERQIAPGVQHIFIRKEAAPWEINVVQIDLAQAGLYLGSALSDGTVLGNKPLTAIADSVSTETRYAVAAINGDFFRRPPELCAGDPLGLQIIQGELVSFPYQTRSALLMTSDQQLRIERLRVDASITRSDGKQYTIHGLNEPRFAQQLILYTRKFGVSTYTNGDGMEAVLQVWDPKLQPNSKMKCQVLEIRKSGNTTIPPNGIILSGHGTAGKMIGELQIGEALELSIQLQPRIGPIIEAIGGGPQIVHNGKIQINAESFSSSILSSRHPRSAIGFSGKRLLFVTVDGRQPQISAGMTLKELAQTMIDLGCKEAMNLDGGGSTEMIIGKWVVNSPSDGGERAIANALVLFSSAPVGAVSAMNIQTARPAVLVGEKVQIYVWGQDPYYSDVEINTRQAEWTVTPTIGSVNPDGLFMATARVTCPTDVTITAQVGNNTAQTTLKVYPLPASLEITPATVQLKADAMQRFVVEGKGPDGTTIPSQLLQPEWACSPEIGQINRIGVFRAARNGAVEGTVGAQLGSAAGQARIKIQ